MGLFHQFLTHCIQFTLVRSVQTEELLLMPIVTQ